MKNYSEGTFLQVQYILSFKQVVLTFVTLFEGASEETTLGILNRELFCAIADLGMENDDYVLLLQKYRDRQELTYLSKL